MLKQIERLKPLARFFYAEEPIYSFHAGIPMPPELAVVPLKRLWAGDMTNARIAEEMSEVKPEIILLKSGTTDTPFNHLLAAEYRPVYEDGEHRLYARKLCNLGVDSHAFRDEGSCSILCNVRVNCSDFTSRGRLAITVAQRSLVVWTPGA